MEVPINDAIFYAILFVGLYYQVFLLVTMLEKSDSGTSQGRISLTPSGYPTVAITIPCFNEERTLERTVHSLMALEYPKDKLEIIIVDDGSTDGTYAVAKKLEQSFPQIKLFSQENGGKYTALNFGLSCSDSDLVGCLDADSFVDKNALKNMVEHFSDPNVMAVTPAIRVHDPKNILQLIQKAEYNAGVFLKQLLGKLNAIHVTPGPFSIFRRKVFDTLGGYKHAHNTEDMEIACRMQAHYYKIKNCPSAHVYTVTPDTVKKLHRQRVRWIYGFLQNAIDYKYLFFSRKYGNMGVLTLPVSLFFIFTSLYGLVFMVKNITKLITEKYVYIDTVGINPSFNMSYDLFFLNIQTFSIIVTLVTGIGILFLLLGKHMAEGTTKPGKEILYFLCFYGFIAPFWVLKAVYNTVFKRKTSWR